MIHKLLSIAFVLCLLSVKGMAQTQTTVLTLNEDKTYGYEHVFELPGRSQEQLYNSLKNWVLKNVINQTNSNYFDDKGKALVTTAPVIPLLDGSLQLAFKLSMEIKEGKYRLTATSLTWINPGYGTEKALGDFSGMTGNKKRQASVIQSADDGFGKVVASIQAAAGKSTDW